MFSFDSETVVGENVFFVAGKTLRLQRWMHPARSGERSGYLAIVRERTMNYNGEALVHIYL
jgi:hypothetical protein